MRNSSGVCVLMVALVIVLAPSWASAQGGEGEEGGGSGGGASGELIVQGQLGWRLGLGDWSDVSHPGIGGTLGLLYTLTPQFVLSGRAGFFWGVPREREESVFGFLNVSYTTKTNEVPLLLGGRYFFGGNPTEGGVWVGGELGLVNLTSVVTIGDEEPDRDAEVEFALLAGGGYDLGGYGFGANLLWLPGVESGEEDGLLGLLITVDIDIHTLTL